VVSKDDVLKNDALISEISPIPVLDVDVSTPKPIPYKKIRLTTGQLFNIESYGDIRKWIDENRITIDDEIFTDAGKWKRISDCEDLLKLFGTQISAAGDRAINTADFMAAEKTQFNEKIKAKPPSIRESSLNNNDEFNFNNTLRRELNVSEHDPENRAFELNKKLSSIGRVPPSHKEAEDTYLAAKQKATGKKKRSIVFKLAILFVLAIGVVLSLPKLTKQTVTNDTATKATSTEMAPTNVATGTTPETTATAQANLMQNAFYQKATLLFNIDNAEAYRLSALEYEKAYLQIGDPSVLNDIALAYAFYGFRSANRDAIFKALDVASFLLTTPRDYKPCFLSLFIINSLLEKTVSIDQAKRTEEYLKALPTDTPFHSAFVGIVYKKLGQLEEASKAFFDAIQKNPSFLLPYRELIDIGKQTGNDEIAQNNQLIVDKKEQDLFANYPELKNALNQPPDVAKQKQVVKQDTSAKDKSEKPKVIAEKPSAEQIRAEAEAHYKKGSNAITLGDYKAAQSELKKAIELYPDYGDAYKSLGLLLYELGEKQNARVALQKYITINPTDPERSDIDDILKEIE